ncbi:hypothetical protein LCGC14_0602020 [marine sediment metagenome]|uniref:Uncharacterized protein n=1 Tax=marine sediment metagenome TaxID=412755 RepID=A0A0F9RAG3_9ZZZZ
MSALNNSINAGDKWTGSPAGSVGTAAVLAVTFKKKSKAIRLVNLHATNNLLYSLDGGSNYFTIGPNGSIDRAYRVNTLHVKGSGSSTGYDLEYTEQQ